MGRRSCVSCRTDSKWLYRLLIGPRQADLQMGTVWRCPTGIHVLLALLRSVSVNFNKNKFSFDNPKRPVHAKLVNSDSSLYDRPLFFPSSDERALFVRVQLPVNIVSS